MNKDDKLIDDRTVALRTVLQDEFGIVDPGKLIKVSSSETLVIALVDPWPVGIDKRRADLRLKEHGFQALPGNVLGPYSSTYVLWARPTEKAS